MTIDDIYRATRERGLVPSQRQFSQEFLGRAPNYIADRGFSRCSAEALLNLYRRFGELGEPGLQAMAFARLLDAEARDGDGVQAVRP